MNGMDIALRGAQLAQINFEIDTMGEGTAILVIGITALLLAASKVWDNPLAGIGSLLTVLFFVVGATLDMGSELYWMGVISTVVILIVGLVVQVGR